LDVISQTRDVKRFLVEFKSLMSSGGLYDAKPSQMNESLLDLKLNRMGRNSIIYDLTFEDYCEGPINDRDKPGSLWIFGKEVNSTLIYIKIKIVQSEGEKGALCLSFHRANEKMNFPLAGK